MSPAPAPNGCGIRVQVLDDVVNTDLKAARNEYHFRTPLIVTALSSLLKDPRDVPMLCLMLNIVQVVVPGLVLLYGINMYVPQLPLLVRNLAGLLYVVSNVLLFQERFTLMLHFASHRAIFHTSVLNNLLDWVFAPFFGIPCGLYKIHHVIMHHIENNHELDISSTENYRRDSWSDFIRYWFHFAVLIWIELPHYAFRTKRYGWLRTVGLGAFVWLTGIVMLARCVNLLATVWAFVVPYAVAMSVMAFGNWSQHIFVNPQDSQSNMHLTYNCIDTKVNQTTFNDGYHVIHHMNARLHWSEVPEYFYQTKDKHLEGGALTFRGVHFFDVGFLVMTKRLGKLAEHYVHLGSRESAPTILEVEERLRRWLAPVAAPATQETAKKAE
mmetsp:Transcript_126889/g.353321  ORF Transcript_126889/g.353321 Transcript_126889/m.353321 type:complete len:383 (-) Transcript_126889:299-1447(-)|eukprot:CAMPEP_0179080172 /NCGR_PEP_ID=MMETSP0796-20121207/36016_1 /TAXON_ID=73915 /ORGANISM="Pyrodinium bahamense, Strain pbaha01" /LENGTH=382 /DNA_ID=CAMNT_0020777521 /DNA_START=73 /DNA_END=1221 /DNA_ORIENTATION=-